MKLNSEQKVILVSTLLIAIVVYYSVFKKQVYDFEETSSVTGKDALYILKEWKEKFDTKDLDGITNLYTSEAILVSTFDGIMKGRNEIKDYFDDLFEKQNLKVEFIGKPHIGVVSDLTIFTGVYVFSYTNKDGSYAETKARYSILCKLFNGKLFIIKQHSSAFHK